MPPETSRELLNRMRARFDRLYGPRTGERCLKRLKLLLGLYEARLPSTPAPPQRWTAGDNILITYPDMVRRAREKPLVTLSRFLHAHLRDVIDTVHLLPFFPSSSDEGFSVTNYREVDPMLGDWERVDALGRHFRLMFDLVLNHCSKHNEWFTEYITGVAPQRDYFIEADPFEDDLSRVVRPRRSPLLTSVDTHAGERWVWTTFSEDQVDLNFKNPNVLLEFLDVILFYLSHGARALRLDAIAYLWKEIGTPSIHLPQTHEVVRLIHDLLELVAPDALVVTETNVPHEQNIRYFGQGDEAHLVYNFTLPPLLLHALHTGSGRELSRWASELKPPPLGCSYLNFTASHDGIGVRPLEGILTEAQIQDLCEHVRSVHGHVSEKADSDGRSSPYELNITYFDAMGGHEEPDAEMKIRRFLCSQIIALVLRGVPAVYFQSLVAGSNDPQRVREHGHYRAINRRRWDEQHLEGLLADPSSVHARVFRQYTRLLSIRADQPALHPDAPQRILDLGDAVFAVERKAPDQSQTMLSISNLRADAISLDVGADQTPLASAPCRDLLDPNTQRIQPPPPLRLQLEPYQCLWLSMTR